MTRNFILLLIAISLMVSCENDFQPFVRLNPTPVVYGILSPEDSTYQILLLKSFVGPRSFRDMAQTPDSLYYKNFDAWLELKHLNGQLMLRKKMDWIDGPEQSVGVFNRYPNKILALDAHNLPLDFENNSNKPYAYVSLNIHIKDSNQDVLANTQLIRKPVITSPDKDYLTPVTLYSEDPFELTWWKDSVYYEAFIDFNYELYTSNQWIKKTVRFKYLFKPEMPEPFDTEHVQIVGDVFFEKLANKIKDDQPGDVRRFNSIDFAVQSSDPALYEYIKTTNADLDVELGSFSNVENGLGVFVLARKTELNGYPLDYRTLDSLRSGRFTRHLNFVAW